MQYYKGKVVDGVDRAFVDLIRREDQFSNTAATCC